MSTFRPLTGVILLVSALGMNACSSIRHHPPAAKNSDPQLSEQRQANLDFSLTNFTGGPLTGVYLSPSASSGWEENLLGGSELKSGTTLNISFSPNETAIMWDLRIEGALGGYAEWKNLKLEDISDIRLVVEHSPELKVIAELE